MGFLKQLNEHIESMLIDDAEEEDIAASLLSEDGFFFSDDTLLPILESVRRTVVKRGGVRHVTRRIGRPNPYRSAIAKRSAKAHRGSRMRGQMKYRNSAKAKRDKTEIKRFNTTRRTNRPLFRPARRPKFHGPPRRSTKARTFRPPRRRRF